MKKHVDRYKLWYSKTEKNLKCSKGNEGDEILVRLGSLTLRENVLGCLNHSKVLHKHVSEFSEEKGDLRWLRKLVCECERWVQLFECTSRISELEPDDVIQALVESEIDIDFAISLV